MRLTTHEQTIIKETLKDIDPAARIYLFGSRTDDGARGGDIDLLVESPNDLPMEKIAEFRWRLMEALGEQKFDIVVADGKNQAFVETIRPRAMELH